VFYSDQYLKSGVSDSQGSSLELNMGRKKWYSHDLKFEACLFYVVVFWFATTARTIDSVKFDTGGMILGW